MKRKKFNVLYAWLLLFLLYFVLIIINTIQIGSHRDNINNFKVNYGLQKLELKDVLITVKTCKQNHYKRLRIIAHTWYEFAKSQVNKTNVYIKAHIYN